MHPMRRQDRMMSREDSIQFLKESSFGVLAMSDGNEPYAIPLNHFLDGDTLYFHAATEGRKNNILSGNPRVTFVVSEFSGFKDTDSELLCSLGAFFRSVICTGHARYIADAAEKARIVTALTRHLVRDLDVKAPDVTPEQVGRVTILAVDIESISGKACLPV